jgi:hypothetical protein
MLRYREWIFTRPVSCTTARTATRPVPEFAMVVTMSLVVLIAAQAVRENSLPQSQSYFPVPEPV